MANDQGRKPVVHTKKHVARLERERRQTRAILYIFIGILVIVVGLLLYGWLDINYFQLNRAVAKAGENEISLRQFEARVRLRRRQLLNEYNMYVQYYQYFGLDVTQQVDNITKTLDGTVDLGQGVLDQMIEEELIRQEAAKRGITVSEQELDEYIQTAFQYTPNGTPTPSPTPTTVITPTVPPEAYEIVTITPTPTNTPEVTATLEVTATPEITETGEVTGTPGATGTAEPSPTATLAPTETPTETPTASPTVGPTETATPTATPYTLEGFQGEYQKSVEGFSNIGISAEQYRALFETELLRTKLFDAITADVPHAEEQLWARHILLADEASAKAVLERLKAGEDFGALAAELSQDPGSGSKGGDLGWFSKGAMVAPFEEAAFKLKPGEISDPVQSDFGYHIIQVIARQERPFSADQYEAKRNQVFQDWLTKAKEDYGVETFDIWASRVPTEPNLTTMATEIAVTSAAQLTEQAKFTPTPAPTETPAP